MDIKTFATTLFITGVATCGSAHANDPSGSLNVSPRETKSLVTWQFSRDSLHWQTVRIPHDWAIAGPFDKKWDIQYVAIEQNGEKEKTEKSGRSGAFGCTSSSAAVEQPKIHGKQMLELHNVPPSRT